jgi:hypothetical protein
MVDLGNGYTGTSIPTVTIAGMSGSPAATAIMSLALQSVTLGAGGSGYGTGAAPVWFTSDGLVAGTNNNAFFLPRNAIGTTTVVGGSVTAFTVEDAGFGFQKVPQVTVSNTSAIATAQATGIAVVGGVNDSSLLQPRVQ